MQAEIRAFLASLESQPSYSMSTRFAYAHDLTSFLGYLQERLSRPPEISDINTSSIASYLDSENLKGKKFNTLLRRKAALRLFKIFLSDNGYLSFQSGVDDWLPEIRLDHKFSPSNLQVLTPEQVQMILRTIENGHRGTDRRDSAILALLLHTGLMVSKLISLNLEDINLSAGTMCLTVGQREEYWFQLDSSAPYLERYIREGRPNLNPYIGETALFINQIGLRLTRQGIWQILKHWGNLSQVSTSLTPRAIRHTAALQLAHSGLPLSKIQILLGHTNPHSTLSLLHRLESAVPHQTESHNQALMAGREQNYE
jgi:integrase/recombinase XerD